MDLKNMGCEDVDWVYTAQRRDQSQALVNITVNLLVPQKAQNVLYSWATLSPSRRSVLCGIN
jgi:hypothetical protein